MLGCCVFLPSFQIFDVVHNVSYLFAALEIRQMHLLCNCRVVVRVIVCEVVCCMGVPFLVFIVILRSVSRSIMYCGNVGKVVCCGPVYRAYVSDLVLTIVITVTRSFISIRIMFSSRSCFLVLLVDIL